MAAKSLAETNKPREVVHKVIEGFGGVEKCSSMGQMVRNRQQVKDLVRNGAASQTQAVKNLTGQRGKADDPWYQLLIDSKRQARDCESAFIRDVRVAPEPLCVLTNRQQLKDIKRFCCDPTDFQPLTVDPTFDIGKYSVTVTTYQHLVLENRSDSKQPSFIGPVMIHHKKTKETYSSFCGVLRSLEPSLQDLLAFGTDDETALENAFDENFERAIHLLCELHMKRNIEGKLQEMGIRGTPKEQIVYDIFGRRAGAVHEKGLNDAENEESFTEQLEVIGKKWVSSYDKGEQFLEWFKENKRAKFLKSVVASVRERAGLGNPPAQFTTNRCERSNGLIQDFLRRENSTRAGKCDEHTFAVALEKLVKMQQREAELAIIGKGEYRLREKFDHLFVPANDWNKMTENQKKSSLRKVHDCEVEDCRPTAVSEATSRLVENSPILQQFQQARIDWIPQDHLQRITTKAAGIMNEPEK